LKIARADTPPDLILLDIMMPEVDGYEVCRQLQADEKTRNIPIIFLTARNEASDEQLGLELGAVDYITKPISPPIVLARVKNHLALKHLRDLDQRRMVMLNEEKKLLSQEKQLLELEQMKTDRLMLNILPRPIAERLKRGEKNIAGSYAESTILFSDLVGFTEFSSKISSAELVKLLNDLFNPVRQARRDAGLGEDQDHRRLLHGSSRHTHPSLGPRRVVRRHGTGHVRRPAQLQHDPRQERGHTRRSELGAGGGRRHRLHQVLL
jgi:CheY-like chemotaxis protein